MQGDDITDMWAATPMTMSDTYDVSMDRSGASGTSHDTLVDDAPMAVDMAPPNLALGLGGGADSAALIAYL